MTDAFDTEENKNKKPKGPSFFQVMQSIGAGALGVQSSKRREEAFGSHSPWPYILGGLIFTALFIGILLLVVQLALSGR